MIVENVEKIDLIENIRFIRKYNFSNPRRRSARGTVV